MLPKVTKALHVGVHVLLAASFAIFLTRGEWIAALSVGLIFLLANHLWLHRSNLPFTEKKIEG